ncbi:MAG TPA: DUF3536 domain-containing protein, partial [Dehalococcoidia bacterium]|nr:DUF3536 domain-containing protein [Dehalococcoidia bacterium]
MQEHECVTVLQLMELQRHAMLMYTSCGWFFDELSGIETVQVIAYAGRVLQLARELFGKDLEGPFLERLQKAKSNLPDHRDGRQIYLRWVKPGVVGWDQITAHYAVSSLFAEYAETSRVFCYTAERRDYHSLAAGKARLVVGRARVRSEVTHEEREMTFGVLHFGDHNVNGGACEFPGDEAYRKLLSELTETFERADFPQVLRLLDRGFGESTYSLKSLFRDEQRKVVDRVLQARRAEAEAVYRRLFEDNLPTMRFLSDIGVPLPSYLRTAAAFIISTDLHWAFKDDDPDLEHIRYLLDEAKRWDVTLDTPGLAFQLRSTLRKMARRFEGQPDDLPTLLSLEQVVDLARSLPFEVDLWEPQNVYFRLMHNLLPELEARTPGDEGWLTWLQHFLELGQKLGIQVRDLKKKVDELQRAPTLASVLDEIFSRTRVPSATYRLQVTKDFPFQRAQAVLPYLHELGVTDCYLSPILQACPGSGHGYDVCDHSRINEELGGRAGFDAFAAALARLRMGLILDTVPNHMGIGRHNAWWVDVLENGPSSLFADYFDIDWHPVNPNLQNKVLLPVLGDQYGAVLESGQIKLAYEDGAFFLTYYDHRLPLAPCTYGMVLELRLAELRQQLGEANEYVQELQSILTAIRHLPNRNAPEPGAVAERAREKEVIKRRIAALVQASPEVRAAIDETVHVFNGRPGEVASFDLLDALLDAQVFRPAFWRVATEEIN